MLKNHIPWSLRGVNPFLSAYGDPFLFGAVRRTPPIQTNPEADTGIHSAVPHRYVFAYLVAIKSFLRYCPDITVYAHDDGSLLERDKDLIREHIGGVRLIGRDEADAEFERKVGDPFLSRIRKSYTSYLKLFDPTLISDKQRIIIVDTDTLFLKPPEAVIRWIRKGTTPWYHRVQQGRMSKRDSGRPAPLTQLQDVHIQTLITKDLDAINETLGAHYAVLPGFNSGFIGYARGTVDFDELRKLFQVLYDRFSEKIFRWGAEQTTHALILGGRSAAALPEEEYFVYTQNNAYLAKGATFMHFIGENRFYRMRYPRLASRVVRELKTGLVQ